MFLRIGKSSVIRIKIFMSGEVIFFVAVKKRKNPKINIKGRIQKIRKNIPLTMNSCEAAIVKIIKTVNMKMSCFLESFKVFLEQMISIV